MMQAYRKAGNTRISEDDWSNYVDYLRRGESWGRKEKGEKTKGN
jgi:hypothetical protein